MHAGERAVVDVPLGIQVALKVRRLGPVHQFHAADLDDTVVEFGLQARVSC